MIRKGIQAGEQVAMSIDRNYESEMNRFLKELDTKADSHSDSRKKEEEKYRRLNALRDGTADPAEKSKIWEGF